jgi:Glycosyl transferase family 90
MFQRQSIYPLPYVDVIADADGIPKLEHQYLVPTGKVSKGQHYQQQQAPPAKTTTTNVNIYAATNKWYLSSILFLLGFSLLSWSLTMFDMPSPKLVWKVGRDSSTVDPDSVQQHTNFSSIDKVERDSLSLVPDSVQMLGSFSIDKSEIDSLSADPDFVQQIGNFSIHVNWHPNSRSERFPSWVERVKLYMSNWYLLPCEDASMGKFVGKYHRNELRSNDSNESWPVLNISDAWDLASQKSELIDSKIIPDHKLLMHRATIQDCARSREEYAQQGNLSTESRITRRWSMKTYCSPMVEFLDIMEQLDGSDNKTPVLAQFGDSQPIRGNDWFEIPLIGKFRAATTKKFIAQVAGGNLHKELCLKETRPPLNSVYHQDVYRNKLSPILWKLELGRHWIPLPKALQQDTPWDQKKKLAYWGGMMAGGVLRGANATDLEQCLYNQRCRFVLNHADSTLVDAKLTHHKGRLRNYTVNGTNLHREIVGFDIIQQYKVIICFEGNDVSSGLKWMLQSASVVLMPPPTRTSWAMEELLEPWVHYIPMHPDGSNAEEMVRWVVDNDKAAQEIAERATLFIYDLLYHPDAASDDHKIKHDIVRRYRALWN